MLDGVALWLLHACIVPLLYNITNVLLLTFEDRGLIRANIVRTVTVVLTVELFRCNTVCLVLVVSGPVVVVTRPEVR